MLVSRWSWVMMFMVSYMGSSFAQQLLTSRVEGDQRMAPLDFSIPVSSAFDLLGVNPSFDTRSNALRDIKADWSFRSWRMSPNIVGYSLQNGETLVRQMQKPCYYRGGLQRQVFLFYCINAADG